MYKIMGVVLAVPLGGCLTAAKEAPVAPPLATSELRDLAPAEKALLAKALAKTLKDPESAKFEWTKIAKPLSPTSVVYYCAALNAKNSYGGYVGAAPFMAAVNFDGGKITGASMDMLASANVVERDIVVKRCGQLGLDPFSTG